MALPPRIGRYDVERMLGVGGMGRVLLARDTVLGRHVAVKILRDDLGIPPELAAQLRERMRNEARAAAALSHPGIVTLHDMGEDEQVGLYLVFELIAGPTLRERIEERGALPPAEVAAIARTLGLALAHAHSAGVLHRDVKPENVMLAASGAKLTDLGIARLPDSTLTGATMVLGTPAYSAPEALASGAFSPRGDQFSLAATLYEALTGARAFPGEDALEVATRVATGAHVPPTRQLPTLRRFSNLDALFERGLDKQAARRFAGCEVLGELVAAELEGRNDEALTPVLPPSSRLARKTRRGQNAAALLGIGVIAALVAAGRQHRQGVSLRSVASAFEAAIDGSPRASEMAPHAPPRKARPLPSATTAESATATPAAPNASASGRPDAGSPEPAEAGAPSIDP